MRKRSSGRKKCSGLVAEVRFGCSVCKEVRSDRGSARQSGEGLVQYLCTEVNKKVRQFDEILEKLQNDYPKLRFRSGRKFMFRPPRTVVFEQKTDAAVEAGLNPTLDVHTKSNNERKLQKNAPEMAEIEQNRECLELLHEVGHALLGHCDYGTDVERVKMERAAWEKAAELAQKYGVEMDVELAEEELDTYRDWLHKRSKCPQCGATRYQGQNGEYRCPMCEAFGG